MGLHHFNAQLSEHENHTSSDSIRSCMPLSNNSFDVTCLPTCRSVKRAASQRISKNVKIHFRHPNAFAMLFTSKQQYYSPSEEIYRQEFLQMVKELEKTVNILNRFLRILRLISLVKVIDESLEIRKKEIESLKTWITFLINPLIPEKQLSADKNLCYMMCNVIFIYIIAPRMLKELKDKIESSSKTTKEDPLSNSRFQLGLNEDFNTYWPSNAIILQWLKATFELNVSSEAAEQELITIQKSLDLNLDIDSQHRRAKTLALFFKCELPFFLQSSLEALSENYGGLNDFRTRVFEFITKCRSEIKSDYLKMISQQIDSGENANAIVLKQDQVKKLLLLNNDSNNIDFKMLALKCLKFRKNQRIAIFLNGAVTSSKSLENSAYNNCSPFPVPPLPASEKGYEDTINNDVIPSSLTLKHIDLIIQTCIDSKLFLKDVCEEVMKS